MKSLFKPIVLAALAAVAFSMMTDRPALAAPGEITNAEDQDHVAGEATEMAALADAGGHLATFVLAEIQECESLPSDPVIMRLDLLCESETRSLHATAREDLGKPDDPFDDKPVITDEKVPDSRAHTPGRDHASTVFWRATRSC